MYDRWNTPRRRLKRPTAAAKPNRRDMARQLPFAVAELLIERIPPVSTAADDDAAPMTPVLHTLIRRRALALPVEILLLALEVLGEGSSLGGSSRVCYQPTGGCRGTR